MNAMLLIEGSPQETRVAVLEEGRVAELHIERVAARSPVGNVYKGRVSRLMPGIEAAFVDIGLDRDAFLLASDAPSASSAAEEVEDPEAGSGGARRSSAAALELGDEIVVQVVKQPRAGKGARVSSRISLPGRLLVLLPGVVDLAVSRRIDDAAERQRLEEQLAAIGPGSAGLIARTAAAGRSADELQRELAELLGRWELLRRRSAEVVAPSLLLEELELPLRAVRDLVSEDCSEIWVDGESTQDRIERYLDCVDPSLIGRLRRPEGAEPLFERFSIERAITLALRDKVWLDSGGFIVISPTEALVAIDVNTGSYSGESDLESTALCTNLEAAAAVARQLRLRDLSGIIVVDFIDMTQPDHRSRVLAELTRRLAQDRARTQISGVSEFGLVEITRKRMRSGLSEQLTEPCPCCSGRGRVRSAATVIAELERTLVSHRRAGSLRALEVRAHPRLVAALENERRETIAEMEKRLGLVIRLEPDPDLKPGDYLVRPD